MVTPFMARRKACHTISLVAGIFYFRRVEMFLLITGTPQARPPETEEGAWGWTWAG